MAPKIIFIGGVHASGKSTVLEAVARRFPRGSVKHVEYGEEARKIARRIIPGFKHDLIALPDRWKRKLKKMVVEKTLRSRAKVVLWNNHYTWAPNRKRPEVFEDIVKKRSRALLPHIRHFVLIESPLREVRIRRIIDSGAKPRPIGEEGIRREIESQHNVAKASAREQRRPLAIIINRNGSRDRAARQIERIVRRHL